MVHHRIKALFSRHIAVRVAVATCAALLPVTAFADFLNMNGDGVTTISTQPMAEEYAIDFGTVCQGSGVQSKTFQLEIAARSHADLVTNAPIIFQNGSTVTVSVSSTNGTGLGASVAAPGTIALPSNWTSLPDGTFSNTVNSTLTLDTGAVSGTVADTVVYAASGTNLNGSALVKNSTLDVKANVVNCAADVSVVKTAAKSSINAGDTASFSIVLTNNGPNTATNATLSDTLPSGLTWTLGGPDAASCALASGAVTCNFGSVSYPGSRTITVSATTTTSNCGTINNTATVNASNDSNSANNSSTASITVNCAKTAQFAPTNTTCQQFANGTATTQNAIIYNLKNGVINNVSPGVLFYYTTVVAPASSFTVTVSQSDNGTTPALGAMQLSTYTGNCNTYSSVSASTNSTGTSTFDISGATPGQVFILSVKVDPHTVNGSAAPTPSTVTYTYTTSVNGTAVPSSVQQVYLEP